MKKLWPSADSSDEIIVILQPLAMTIPNQFGIYCPSQIRPKREISYREFLAKFADHARICRVFLLDNRAKGSLRVNIDSDYLLSRSMIMTTYGFGLDCWYLVDEMKFPKEEPMTNTP